MKWVPDNTEILESLAAVTGSDCFANSSRLRDFLAYVVNETLEGRADSLKAFSIALDVFDRDASFNAESDALVRVQAGRLRAALKKYYDGEGAGDAVRIDLPKGGYVPTFTALPDLDSEIIDTDRLKVGLPHKIAPLKNATKRRKAAIYAIPTAIFLLVVILAADLWRTKDTATRDSDRKMPPINTLGVIPVGYEPRDEQLDRLSFALTEDLMDALGRGNFLSVVLAKKPTTRDGLSMVKAAKELNVRFLLTGSLRREYSAGNELTALHLSLLDGETGFALWTEAYQYTFETNTTDYGSFLETILFDLHPAVFASAKRTIQESKSSPETALELYLISNWIPGTEINTLAWQKERIALAKKAVVYDPSFGSAHSVLADKFAYLAIIDPPSDTPENIAAAATHASKTLTYAHSQPDATFNLAIYNVHIGRIKEAAAFARRTAELDRKHVLARFYTKVLPFTCRTAPKELIQDLVKFDTELSSLNPARWIIGTWIARMYLNNGDYHNAVIWGRRAAKIFASPDSSYQLAASLVQAGDKKAARRIFEHQKKNWPNMDPEHYANTAIPRRCNGENEFPHLHQIYKEMAAGLKSAGTVAKPD